MATSAAAPAQQQQRKTAKTGTGRPRGRPPAKKVAKDPNAPKVPRPKKRPANPVPVAAAVAPLAVGAPAAATPDRGKRSRVKKDYASMAAGAALPPNMK